jgi:hypothetical protein
VNGWGNNREKGDPEEKKKKGIDCQIRKWSKVFVGSVPHTIHTRYTVLYIPGTVGRVTDNALKVMPASSVLTGYFLSFFFR